MKTFHKNKIAFFCTTTAFLGGNKHKSAHSRFDNIRQTLVSYH